MKKYIIAIVLLIPMLVIGQSTTENYVKTTTYLEETNEGEEDNVHASKKIESIGYVDGLGRPIQSIAVRAGGQNQNITTHIEYDALGRSPKQYLPFASDTEVTNPLNFTDPTALKSSIYQFYDTSKYEDTQNPYSEMVYENSPLNRILEQASPGNSWALSEGHTIKSEYGVNSVNEVRYFDVSFIAGDSENPELTLDGHYGAGQLYKTIIKDENWTSTSGNNHTTEEFTNKLGQVVLKRTYDNNQAHDTYYVYDDYGNLTFVLSPKGSDDIVIGDVLRTNALDILNDLCYQYKYDHRNRLIEKKVPGKGWEYIVYNKLDQPILTQDANQRAQSPKEWLFTKYDAFGRVAYTGIKKSNLSRTSFQSDADNSNVQYETMSLNDNTIADTQVYYSNTAVPNTFGSGDEILTVNYYDTYIDHDGINLPSHVFSQNLTSQTKGLPTVSKVRVLDTDHWITSLTGYDYKARPILSYSENTYLNTVYDYRALLDFTGNTLESITSHQKGDKGAVGTVAVTTRDYYTYDHQNRLLSHKQRVGNEPLQLIASNTYDELGQLIGKDVGGETTFDGYTDMVKVSIDQDGNIEKIGENSSDNSWNAGLKTKGEIKSNGGIRFTTPHDAFRYYRVGLINTTTNNEDDRYFDYGIYIKASDDNNDGFSDVNIILGSINPISTYVGQYQAGDIFKIERSGSQILFKKNNTTFYSVSADINVDYVAKASLFSYNAKINDLTLFGDYIDKRLQKVDYEYNVRGWLTDINPIENNTSSSRSTDIFHFHINYDSPVEGSAGIAGRAKPLYNGNISQTIWKTSNTDNQKRTYGYKYDALNRIKRAYSYKGYSLDEYDNYGIRDLTYDFNGNLLSLIRAGKHFNLDSALEMDNLSYNYQGNQLLSVTDSSSSGISHQGFYDGNTTGDDYSYDMNGNMISDNNKGIEAISYNHLNLPISIQIDTANDGQDNTQNGTIEYVYDATGVKLAKIVTDNNQNTTVSTFYADGGYIYEDESLKMFPHPEGYVEPVYNTTKSISKFDKSTGTTSLSGYQYVFNYTDHLGNIRLTYADSDGNGSIRPSSEIISEKQYYPFGLRQQGYNDVVTSNANSMAERFAYNGKEENPELGINWMDFGARNYNASIGRWMNIDPLADAMRRHSPYNYGFDNPIFFIDPDGMMPQANCDWCKKFLNDYLIGTGIGHRNFIKNTINGAKTTVGLGVLRINSILEGDFDTFSKVNGIQVQGTAEGIINTVMQPIEGAIDVANGRTVEGFAKLAESSDNASVAVVTDGIARGVLSSTTRVVSKTDDITTITIDGIKYPESATHLQDAIDSGIPNVGVIDRAGSSARRKANLKGVKTQKGLDRDEAPPAVMDIGGPASVRLINRSDNRGSGSKIGHQLKGIPDGTKVKIIPVFNFDDL